MQIETVNRNETETYSLTAALVAARLEDGDAIQLVIADPLEPARTIRVMLPALAGAAGGELLRRRMQASRDTFIDVFGLPSFEGFVLLYGDARLTLARDGGPYVGGAAPYVIDFEALDAAAPTPCLAPELRIVA